MKKKPEHVEEPIPEPTPEAIPEEPAPEAIEETPIVEDKPKTSKCPTCSKRGQKIYGLHWDEGRKNPVEAYACEKCKTIYFE
ncbi:MAG: hypothetical protein UY48_C0011G0013 [Candidatus Gottesmanbacteria bacterium GW2011_GWB1_49_7]|uniref:Uncharacterized protein n=1 Tax=Candidatus Gottesmanbacteria bacterium GW2011_GWB1_49_7 TaxID=1618448 RepID=A0A0G1W1E4_9BACT|nr:MAG: hypothetical protein UY48_C0011G0013 [Candidatus Gottesmanbacteria bacterium GW2011_GWB1_49_7]